MPHIKAVTLIEIDGVQFTKEYLSRMMPVIESLARTYMEHSDKIDNATVLELEDPQLGCYSVWWDDLESLAIELAALLV